MLNLIHNENLKLYYRKSTAAMIISLLCMTIFFAIIARIYDYAPNRGNVWDAMAGEVWLMFIVNIFALIVASGIVANEFSWGTIKFLLTRPVSRSKILISKYMALLLYPLLLTSIVFGASLITNSMLYPFHASATHLPMLEGEKVFIHSTFYGLLTIFVLKYIEVVIYGTIAFTASVLSRNTAFATGVSLMSVFFGPLAAVYLSGKYMLFSNLDLTGFVDKMGNIDKVGLSFSLKVLSVYFLAFMFISWAAFTKRDVEV